MTLIWRQTFQAPLLSDLHVSCAHRLDVCTLLLANTPPSLNQSCHFTISQVLPLYLFSRFYITGQAGTRLVKTRLSFEGVGVREGSRGGWGREK